MNVAQETLGFRRAGLSPALSLLMSAFALPIPPAALSSRLHRPTERSPTTHAIHSVRSSTDSTQFSQPRRTRQTSALRLDLKLVQASDASNVLSGLRASLASVIGLQPRYIF